MSVKFGEGTVLWLVPIRYWEQTAEPERCVVIEPVSERSSLSFLYVFHEGYGHETYVPAERCYTSREKAITAAQLLSQLKALKDNDEHDYIFQHCVLTQLSQHTSAPQFCKLPVTRKRRHMDAACCGYVVFPKHHLSYGPKVQVSCSNFATIYWDEYRAAKVAQEEKRCQMEVVEVEVIPISIVEQHSVEGSK